MGIVVIYPPRSELDLQRHPGKYTFAILMYLPGESTVYIHRNSRRLVRPGLAILPGEMPAGKPETKRSGTQSP